ncbi:MULTISPECIES: CoA-binding protein [unclassified Leeuwenhoekiella]|uniref:CoA-binding protein n=1 Tax=unclassified Leeuwenhoekiella TaxID=2615029 RepID=UPI000C4E1E8F|nr:MULTISPECIES: CoA-binding protein [unclassified Leeuwenhoekiella]MAW94112.1 CoA-binding protein [Leeuwenhoekiella sp.]MBA82409.1 CoA-binding protein [Leeuwenhoekiella sp.]|tara:strand:+ start:12796 stop:13158 length:363 start_codon:yes stop_codon:yes gene_type:complete
MKKKTLVLGASLNPSRYSHMAIKRLVQNEQPVVALGLREGSVAGVAIDTGKPAYEGVHTVTLYLNPQRQEEYYEYIMGLNPQRVIFNPGTENPYFAKKLKAAGVEPDYACTLVLLGTNSY